MSEVTMDRRVRRTRHALHTALLALIVGKNFDAITVEELATRADVARTTFYLHYQDKEALLLEVTGDFSEEVQAEFLTCLEDGNVHIEDVVAVMFSLASENVSIYRAIISGQCGAKVLQQFQDMLIPLFIHILETQAERGDITLSLPADFMAHYFLGALKETVVWWVDQEQPIDKNDIISMFYRLSILGTGRILHTDPAQWNVTVGASSTPQMA